jgi:hypothetical protein
LQQLTHSEISIGIDALKIKGALSMNKLILANRFQLNYIVNLEQTVVVQKQQTQSAKSKIGKGAKQA